MSAIDLDGPITIDSHFLNKKGLCGLNNLGNTCFMNSIIQCISNTIPLTKYFLSNEYKEYLNVDSDDKNLAEQWNILVRQLWHKNGLISPIGFLKTVQSLALKKGYNEFTGFGQNDSQEFLNFFLESLHNSFKREVIMRITGKPKNEFDKIAIEALESWKKYYNNDYSKIVELFYGQYISDLHTITNNREERSKTYDPFNTISLEVGDNLGEEISIYDCLDNFTSNEKLDIDDKDKTIFKKISFWKLPKILIIFFKKYHNRGNKINKLVDFPLENLDLSKYVMGYNRDKYKYDLFAITNHIGGTGGGHYYSYVKNYDNNWYKYDDNIVTTLKVERVISNSAYCLFYRIKS